LQPILTVDLSTGQINQFSIPRSWEVDYLGGASLAARILFTTLVQDLDPLSPEAPLLFLNGPLSGTAGPAVGRFVICGKSPATGLWAESNCGGLWGPELRMTGHDGLWVKGKADEPVYISIFDNQVEIRPANHLWGKDTYETQTLLQEDLHAGKVRVASIGIAGEAQIPYALILCDHGRVAGRTGMGAVMGSKNLKAVVVKGNQKIPVHTSERYLQVRSEANRALKHEAQSLTLRELGTSGIADYFDYLGELPKKYFSRGKSQEEIQPTGANLKEKILSGVSACHACVIACGRVVHLDGKQRKGPEYETMAGFGPNLGINDLEFTARMGELCDRYGMDSISLSNTLGLAMKLYEDGKISSQATGGFDLTWGNQASVERLVHQTAIRQGFGSILAQGARALGKLYESESDAVQVNGLEVAYHDPRGASGMALVYATSPRGACHNQSDYFLVDIGQVEPSLGCEYFNRHGGAEKALNVAKHQDWRTLFNSLVLCYLANVPPETVADLINFACGLDWDVSDLMRCGERGWNLKRVINIRLGLTAKSDQLPKALLLPYQDSLPRENAFVPDYQAMLIAYYQARGWDAESGVPLNSTLSKLDLDWVTDSIKL
jgi:aldehyde:ferredoxin oxidoreductase